MAVSADIEAAAAAVMPDVASILVEPLPGGSSAFVVCLVLQSPSGQQRRAVFRQHTNRAVKAHTAGVAAKEFHLTKALAAEGFEVAQPLALHGEQTSDGPWLVTEWIQGSTAVDAVDAALSQMAYFLARLHAIDPETLSVPGLAQIEDPVQALPFYVPSDQSGQELSRLLDLGVQRRPNADVLLHGDFWPGNVLVDRTELAAVLDWEDACYGDPLADLACARVELKCAYGQDASEDFTALYLDAVRRQGMPLFVHDLALWDVYVSSTALSTMHLWGLSPEYEAARRATTKKFLGSAISQLAQQN